METKYIFVTGGVVSGIGKGITAASLGRLLKSRNLHVTLQKFDPYINIDPGIMSPFQHGEVFVTDDGAECDLDIGHYERFTDENLNKNSNITSGKIYWNVILKERRNEYGGGTVQVIPHVTNEIKERVYCVGKNKGTDIVITEIGGTIGDMESLPFIEAIRQIATEVGRENCIFVHVTLVPYLSKSGEQKSKPTQHSIKNLLSLGIQPDIIVCRSELPLEADFKKKISLHCNVSEEAVIENLDADTLYEIPLKLEKEGFASVVCRKLCLPDTPAQLDEWELMVNKSKLRTKQLTVALVGKYVELKDAYLSLVEALNHAGIENDAKINIAWINAEEVTSENCGELLSKVDGVIVPAGFGDRGTQGMIETIKYVRENDIPFLGIGLGMQLSVVEFLRNVAGLADADSTEFNKNTSHPVITCPPSSQEHVALMSGSHLHLGLFPVRILKESKAYTIYGEELVYERHRNKYDVNNDYDTMLSESGMVITGKSPDRKTAEIVEIPQHKWFVGTAYMPEFRSRPNAPHPLFVAFVKSLDND